MSRFTDAFPCPGVALAQEDVQCVARTSVLCESLRIGKGVALEVGLREKGKDFVEKGLEIYAKAR